MEEEERPVTGDGVNKEDEMTTSVKRIFLGGLGGSVTEGDIKKTFSRLGSVSNVEIVRTKCRSFAYMDFFPSSHNALSRLLSTYNGCCWKGGRLKLERANEHYMAHLRREWAEDAQSPVVITDKNLLTQPAASSQGPKDGHKMEDDIHIYFPKIRKVKALPYKGSGKHKYSFQRLNIPANPIHFCDCDEHSYPYISINRKLPSSSEPQTAGIDKDEEKIMKSVIDKLFKKEKPLNTSPSRTFSNSRLVDAVHMRNREDDSAEDGLTINKPFKKKKPPGDTSDETLDSLWSTDDVLKDDGEDDSAEDGLIINMVGRGSTTINPSRGNTTELQKLEDVEVRKAEKIQGSRNNTSEKKRKLLQVEKGKSVYGDGGVATNSKIQSDKVQKSTRGSSWQHKLSWSQLFRSMEDSSFSLREIIPFNHSDKKETVT